MFPKRTTGSSICPIRLDDDYEIVSRTFAAVICAADAPSAKTAWHPVSSLALCHRSTIHPLYSNALPTLKNVSSGINPTTLRSALVSFCFELRVGPSVWISRLRILYKNKCRDTVASAPTQKPKLSRMRRSEESVPEVAVSWYCGPSHQHTDTNRKHRGCKLSKMHDNDKSVFIFQAACLCPNKLWE